MNYDIFLNYPDGKKQFKVFLKKIFHFRHFMI